MNSPHFADKRKKPSGLIKKSKGFLLIQFQLNWYSLIIGS